MNFDTIRLKFASILRRRSIEPHLNRPSSILANYTHLRFSVGQKVLAILGIVVVSLFYGLTLGATGTVFLLQLLLPFGAIFLLLIWMLPENDRPLRRSVEVFLFVFLTAIMIWPDYLAIAIPGLPWITMARLFAIPLIFVFLVSLSQSPTYRKELIDVIQTSPVVWKAVLIFSIITVLSVIVSDKPQESANRGLVVLYSWVLIYFVSCHVFRKPGRAIIFTYLIWICAIIVCIIAYFEVRKQALPWAGHIPNFLKVQDESVARMLASKVRGSTNTFRAQSKFASPLSLAEYLVLCFPFMLHLLFFHRRFIVRLAALATIPLIVWASVQTDARIGSVGIFLSVLLYVLAWAVMRASDSRTALFPQAVLLAYPVGAFIVLVASLTIQRLKVMIWGSSAYSDSNDARIAQMEMGMPMILQRPWGYGIGRGAEKLGYSNGEGVITIDNYMLTIALELGIIGFSAFVAMFAAGAWYAGRQIPKQFDFETSLIAPAAITAVNFMVIKMVLSQVENHPLYFCVLGLAVALAFRIKQNAPIRAPVAN